jgi:mono/diheme cytochrome c family protein
MSRITRWVCALIVVAAAVGAGCRGGPDAARLEQGGEAYLAHCAVCHGTTGAGDGPLAASIATEGRRPPPPLDAARLGSLGRAGLLEAIASGAHHRADSPMPVWGPHLGAEWTGRIADYLLATPVAGEAGRGAVARYLAAPAGTPPAGRRIYALYCSACHGPRGGGDGYLALPPGSRLSAARLREAPLAAIDDATLARLISVGGVHDLEGSATPGWLFTLSPDDRRALVGYLRALAGSSGRD